MVTMKLMRLLAGSVGISMPSLVFLLMMHGGADAQGDVKAGRATAQKCEACHGLDGLAKIAEAPNLAGQSDIYLVKTLKDYRSGARKNDMMSLVARALKD